MARKRKKLGEILREWGTVSEQQVEQGLNLARGGGKRLGEALVEASLCKEVEIAKALAAQFDMEFINLDKKETQSEIDLSLIPEDLVKKHLVLPMGTLNGRLKLVIHDPMDLELLDLLRFRLSSTARSRPPSRPRARSSRTSTARRGPRPRACSPMSRW
ncbi:MAG: GspE/PulE/PilB domain-containing protein [Planctomycetota bacterium]|jgi:type IV pilus assembly protein PilB